MSTAPIANPATVMIALGLATLLASLPLLLRRIRPNRYYGIRIPAAFASEANWYAVNAYGGRCFLRFGAAIAAGGLILARLPQAPFWVPIAGLFATLALLLVTVRAINRFAEKLPDAAESSAQPRCRKSLRGRGF